MKQVEERIRKEITFHACLLQVMQNRTEDLTRFSEFYFKDVKQKGNLFKKAIDQRLNTIYKQIPESKTDAIMEVMGMIEDALDQCSNLYDKLASEAIEHQKEENEKEN